ncbi:hypothetical protein MtrunA17_Chr4g0070151 [Medicago truncatula]|uniref:Uncharacterized protein n=1 Tax=Medicago truncatula TaxID=3880 RepID=A0A396INQ5_MEDTR|nr:hypothetical protein MtrunA17_Chr4g0070151 [Medicago truncatula]
MVHALGCANTNHVILRVLRHPSLEGFIKFNMDGSSFGNPCNVGFEGISKNVGGNWIYRFS